MTLVQSFLAPSAITRHAQLGRNTTRTLTTIAATQTYWVEKTSVVIISVYALNMPLAVSLLRKRPKSWLQNRSSQRNECFNTIVGIQGPKTRHNSESGECRLQNFGRDSSPVQQGQGYSHITAAANELGIMGGGVTNVRKKSCEGNLSERKIVQAGVPKNKIHKD